MGKEKKKEDQPSADAAKESKTSSKKAENPSNEPAKKDLKEVASSDNDVKPSKEESKAAEGDSEKTSDSDKKEKVAKEETSSPTAKEKEAVKLSGLYAFKLSMSSIYDEKGRFTPVTFLQMKPWVVSQVKTKEKEGYNSVQVACVSQKNRRYAKALKNHLSKAGFSKGASHIREIRQESVENIEVGQPVSIHSVQKGDKVKLQAISKGHGFAGVVKRWGFKGGPASHGSKTHRSSGSIGNRTEPARVMPGKKMAGHYGVETVSLKNVKVMDVVSEENLIVVKGSVPGARNTLVFLSRA